MRPGHFGGWFVLHESIEHASNSYTFTATGGLCPSGEFTDHITVLSQNADATVSVWQVDTS